ncbi:MAG: rod shape-determining protein MreD [Anaerolineae bacterium]|nr:rod shape-determining protein MreD [Anaerolineae bacterium]
MTIYAVGIPLFMIAAVIDSSVFSHLRYLNGQPSLVLVLVVAWGLLNELPDSLPWAFIGGLFVDLLSVTPTGTSSLAYVLALTILAFYVGQIGWRNILVPPLAVIFTTALYQVVVLTMLIVQGNSFPVFRTILTWTIPSLVFNTLLILPMFRLMGRILDFLRPPKVGLV